MMDNNIGRCENSKQPSSTESKSGRQQLDTTRKYDDIIDLPHHESKSRKHMSLEARAAQFAPFAALKSDKEHDA